MSGSDNSQTLYSYYELGVYTIQLIFQKSMKDSNNEHYQKMSFDDSMDLFMDKINSMMSSMHIEFILNCDNICLEIMDKISNEFSEPQKELKSAAYHLGKEVLFLHTLSILSYDQEDINGIDLAKKAIRIYLKELGINDSDVLNCVNFKRKDNKSFDDYKIYLEQQVQFFHMLVKMYLNRIKILPNSYRIKIRQNSLGENSDIKFEYDIVLSFAGEDREYVDLIANELKVKGVRVFYDKFETAKLWGKDLYQYLAYIYKVDARYCVSFISNFYKNNVWTRHELRNAQNRALHENKEYLLPIYLEDVELDGLNDSIGHIKASEYTQSQIIDLILEKLR